MKVPDMSLNSGRCDQQAQERSANGVPSTAKFLTCFLINFPKFSCSHFLNYEVSMMSQRMRGWGRGVQVPLVTPLVNYDVKVFPT